MRKSDILKQQSLHRGDAHSLVLSFLVNFASHARLMRTFLPPLEQKKDVFQSAMRAYVIGMASCLETYFRDLYIYVIERDPAALQKAKQANGRRDSQSVISSYLADGISEAEVAGAQVSFQNAESIDRNFAFFFGKPFFEVLNKFEILCVVPSLNRPGLAKFGLSSGWQDQLARIFILRHEFAHDANSKTLIDPTEMQSLEATAIVICQMSALLPGISARYVVDQNAVPAILLIADIISEDWEIMDD